MVAGKNQTIQDRVVVIWVNRGQTSHEYERKYTQGGGGGG